MPTFPSHEPSYGLTKSSEPTVFVTAFGSGYSQRAVYVVNNDLKSLDLKWEYLSETDADEIETFLEARGGHENFDFTAPGESAASKYICTEWKKTLDYPTLSSITAVFMEVAES